MAGTAIAQSVKCATSALRCINRTAHRRIRHAALAAMDLHDNGPFGPFRLGMLAADLPARRVGHEAVRERIAATRRAAIVAGRRGSTPRATSVCESS